MGELGSGVRSNDKYTARKARLTFTCTSTGFCSGNAPAGIVISRPSNLLCLYVSPSVVRVKVSDASRQIPAKVPVRRIVVLTTGGAVVSGGWAELTGNHQKDHRSAEQRPVYKTQRAMKSRHLGICLVRFPVNPGYFVLMGKG